MKFTEKLDRLMRENNLNRRTFALKCDIPYTTVCGWYDKGYDGVRMNTIRKIAQTFNTGLEYWAYDELPEETENAPVPEGTEAEEEKVQKVVQGLSRLLVEAGWVAPGEDLSDAQLRTLASYVMGLSFYFKSQL